MKMKKTPVRLEKQKDEMEELKKFLNADLHIKIKYYVLLTIFTLILMVLVFISKGQTYGYL